LKKEKEKEYEVKREEGEEVKREEGEDVKIEDVDGEVKKEEGEQEEEEDEDEDEVPYREEIGWREVLGFIVMSVISHCQQIWANRAPGYIVPE